MKRRGIFKMLACTAIAMQVAGATKPIPKYKFTNVYADKGIIAEDNMALAQATFTANYTLKGALSGWMDGDNPPTDDELAQTFAGMTDTTGFNIGCKKACVEDTRLVVTLKISHPTKQHLKCRYHLEVKRDCKEAFWNYVRDSEASSEA